MDFAVNAKKKVLKNLSQDQPERQQSDFNEFEAETKRNNWKEKAETARKLRWKEENIGTTTNTCKLSVCLGCVDVANIVRMSL
jgi:hypothetical protein